MISQGIGHISMTISHGLYINPNLQSGDTQPNNTSCYGRPKWTKIGCLVILLIHLVILLIQLQILLIQLLILLFH